MDSLEMQVDKEVKAFVDEAKEFFMLNEEGIEVLYYATITDAENHCIRAKFTIGCKAYMASLVADSLRQRLKREFPDNVVIVITDKKAASEFSINALVI